MKRIVVSAGDPSGDLILAEIVKRVHEAHPGVYEFEGLCGPASEAAGVKIIAPAHEVAVVGISEVLKNLDRIYGVLGKLRERLPGATALLCVDFPDFNLKLADLARKANVPVDYVVAPQVWAWRSGRIPRVKKLVRRLYPALPFEEALFRDGGVDARYLGHPIRDLLPPKARRTTREAFGLAPDTRALCVMPGSRRTEIARHLPLFLDAWDEWQRLEARAPRSYTPAPLTVALVPIAPGWTKDAWLALSKPDVRSRLETKLQSGEWRLVDDSRRALMAADFGWIVSGTATLEAALYGLPHLLVYKLSALSARVIRLLSHYFSDPDAFAGLPNILLKRGVIPELLQHHVNARRVAAETHELLNDPSRLDEITKSLRYLPKKLGEPGATTRIATDLAARW